jgi:hypothetical protein
MKNINLLTGSLFPVVLVVIGGVLSHPTWAAAEALPKTPEQKLDYVENALAEALESNDWKMMEMCAQGYKALGLSGEARETSFLRAERRAALAALAKRIYGGDLDLRIVFGGLAARALSGDQPAAKTLHAFAEQAINAVPRPTAELWKAKPEQAQAEQKAHAESLTAIKQRDFALLYLALIKAPGVKEKALAALRARSKFSQPMTVGVGGPSGPGDPLILAVLAADPQGGLPDLLKLCLDSGDKADKDAYAVRLRTLQAIVNIVAPHKGVRNPLAAFQLEADIAAALPQNAAAQLSGPFTALVRDWSSDVTVGNASVHSLIGMVGRVPLTDEARVSLEGLRGKMGGEKNLEWQRKQIDNLLEKDGKTVPVRTPAVVPQTKTTEQEDDF